MNPVTEHYLNSGQGLQGWFLECFLCLRDEAEKTFFKEIVSAIEIVSIIEIVSVVSVIMWEAQYHFFNSRTPDPDRDLFSDNAPLHIVTRTMLTFQW